MSAPEAADTNTTLAADWLALVMIQKPVTLDDDADETDEADAAKRRLNAGDRNALSSLGKQARHLPKDQRKVSLE